jgi:hypothetical protein
LSVTVSIVLITSFTFIYFFFPNVSAKPISSNPLPSLSNLLFLADKSIIFARIHP